MPRMLNPCYSVRHGSLASRPLPAASVLRCSCSSSRFMSVPAFCGQFRDGFVEAGQPLPPVLLPEHGRGSASVWSRHCFQQLGTALWLRSSCAIRSTRWLWHCFAMPPTCGGLRRGYSGLCIVRSGRHLSADILMVFKSRLRFGLSFLVVSCFRRQFTSSKESPAVAYRQPGFPVEYVADVATASILARWQYRL